MLGHVEEGAEWKAAIALLVAATVECRQSDTIAYSSAISACEKGASDVGR